MHLRSWVITSSLLALAVLSSRPAGAQEAIPTPRTHLPVHSSILRLPDDLGGGGGLWAVGPRYKVSFGESHDARATYYPLLGKSFPTNLPLTLRLGGIEVPGIGYARAEITPNLVLGTKTLEYRHLILGLGQVLERYEVTDEGLEQSFVLPHAPATPGALTFDVTIETPLTSSPREARMAPVTFLQQGEVIAEYGRAYAIDASGERWPLGVSHVTGRVRIHVPAPVVTRAVFPLTIDPVVGTVIASATERLDAMALGHDRLADEYLVAFTRFSSASDRDLFAVLTNHEFQNPTTVITDVSASWSTVSPAVAFNAAAGKWAVVASREFPLSPPQKLIRGYLHPSGSTTPTGSFWYFTLTSTVFESHPCVGGTASATQGTRMAVAFDRQVDPSRTEVVAGMVDAARLGTSRDPVVLAPFAVESGATLTQRRPALNQEARSNQEPWLLAFERRDNTPAYPRWDIVTYLLSPNGALSGRAVMTSPPTFPRDLLEPKVGGRSGQYLVAARRPGPGRGEIHFRQFFYPPTGAAPAVSPDRLLRYAQETITSLSVAFDTKSHSQWSVAWSESSQGRGAVHFTRIHPSSEVLERRVIEQSASYGFPAAAMTFQPSGDEFAIVHATTETDHPIAGHARTSGAQASMILAGCSAATLQPIDLPFRGNLNFGLRFTGGNPYSPFTIGFGSSQASWMGIGLPIDLTPWGPTGCWLGTSRETQLESHLSGQGQRVIHLPIPTGLDPQDLYVQAFVLEPQANSLGVTLTDAYHLTIR